MHALVAMLALLMQTPVPDPAAAPWWVAIVTPLAAALVGYVSKLLFDGLKQLLPPLDASSSIVKMIASTVFNGLIGFLAAHFAIGVALPGDLHSVTPEWLAAVLNALVAAGIYRFEHNQQASRQGLPTAEQKVDGMAAPVAR